MARDTVQEYIDGWLEFSECCGAPMSTGFDTVTLTSTGAEAQAYYRHCKVCGTMEARTRDELAASV